VKQRLVAAAIALYPKRWRERYGIEVEDLVDELRAAGHSSQVRLLASLVCTGLAQRLKTMVLALVGRSQTLPKMALAGGTVDAGPFGLGPSTSAYRLRWKGVLALCTAGAILLGCITVILVLVLGRTLQPSARTGALTAYDPSDFFSDMWSWNGKSWMKVSANLPLDAVGVGDMVYDSARRQMLLVSDGGIWAWTGQSWQLLARSSSTFSEMTSVTYDESTDQLVALVPYVVNPQAPSPLVATWSWSEAGWKEQSHSVGLPSQEVASDGLMAYDDATGQLMLIATGHGQLPPNHFVSALWTGSAWIEEHPSKSPPPDLVVEGIAYDSATGQLVLVESGDMDSRTTIETWTWNGRIWTEQHPFSSPSPRVGESFAYDPLTRQLLLFGGSPLDTSSGLSGPVPYSDTWDWTGSNWMKIR
jgi:hypothetical protein